MAERHRPLRVSTDLPCGRVLEFGGHAVEGVGNVLAERGHGGDDDDGDQRGDQRVLNRGHGALVDVQRVEFDGEGGANVVGEHWKNPFW